ncbi:YjcZ family sporulation protein [Aquibacillus rhizosphaerae]|uniref:YjcZ family sporulation protein n=1 Tax=Aquibacillus rhizosphaerae TaxID=3051431 RepID=A0ABT7L8G8_9BACI|nr:YjcZ family sporulation protein [Aquibacillus sp. LR5S19]MDL4842171.1 YjcZ family sporulation protein [Aquibacillus sp. LR5S19]
MSHFGYGYPYAGYDVAPGYAGACGGYTGGGYGSSFALIVVLFILLIIVGTAFYA